MIREEESTVVSSASTSIPHSTKARTNPDMVKVRSKKSKDDKSPSKSNLVSKTKPESLHKAQTSYDPANSIVWDIEEGKSLGSEVSSGVKQGTIVLELAHLPLTSNEVLGKGALDTNIPTLEAHVKLSKEKPLSVTQSHALSSPSLGPSQSASQIGLKTASVDSLPIAPSKYFRSLPPRSHLGLTCHATNQDPKPSAFSELGELSTIEDAIPQMPEPASHLHHFAGLPARSYYDGQEVRPNLIPPIQASYDDLEVSVYYDGYPHSEFWSPADHPDGLGVQGLNDIDVSVDNISVSSDGQNPPSFDIPADDEDYIAYRELSEMDEIHDTSFIPLSGHQNTELHNSIPPSMELSDAFSDLSERCHGMVYQYSDRLDPESENQQMQPDGDSNLEHEGISSMDLELYPGVAHHFWQGRSLLYGLSTPGNSSSLHKLSNVEADVARQLQLDHWQPQKL
ncbi:hypothetical protein BYT27DRAFT_7182810 [Phlegmacium glaucopus]|nr:hypothetical protein BYT27DRAFT_7182810 [Phlegmacium glaucopus]